MEHMACFRAPLASLYFSTSSRAFLSTKHGCSTPLQFRSGGDPLPMICNLAWHGMAWHGMAWHGKSKGKGKPTEG